MTYTTYVKKLIRASGTRHPTCPLCRKSQQTWYSFLTHLWVECGKPLQNGPKPECPCCAKPFTGRDNLLIHVIHLYTKGELLEHMMYRVACRTFSETKEDE